jgi:hypothetical protein
VARITFGITDAVAPQVSIPLAADRAKDGVAIR